MQHVLTLNAWIAAVERSQWVIEHYPQTPQVPEALATLAYSYDQLGIRQLRNNTSKF